MNLPGLRIRPGLFGCPTLPLHATYLHYITLQGEPMPQVVSEYYKLGANQIQSIYTI